MLKKLLGSLLDRKRHWNYFTLYENITRWNSSHGFPDPTSLPDKMSLPSSFWSSVKDLHELTLQDEHERAVSVWWIDGDICVTPTLRGDRSSVTSKYSLKVQYIPHTHDTNYTKQVEVDGKTIFKKTLQESEVPHQSTISPLFNLHTHPPHYQDGRRYYHYFSRTDIVSLIMGDSTFSGVITDEVILLCKTNRTPNFVPDIVDDRSISQELLWQQLGLVQFKGTWRTAEFEKSENITYV
ncbi:MAG: hypothetical protein QY314_00155 [Candidatus Dojkabacteria bacterium]|nr:MAG: hypothetical protein QY314_00155 [Candidatus Dojkabacteria bacterium]